MATQQETGELFDAAFDALSRDSNSSVELDVNQLQEFSREQHEHLAILFDLAHEDLAEPGTGKRYLGLEDIRARHHADTTTLSRALGRFERVVQTPFRSLKQGVGTASSYRQPIARVAVKVIPAAPRERLSALTLDILATAALSLLVTGLISPFVEGEYIQGLDFAVIRDISSYAPLIALYLKTFLIALIVYPTTILILHGKTFGLKRNRLKLVSKSGRLPSIEQLVIRGLLMPLALVTAAPLAIISRKQTLSDRYSRTTVSKV